MDSRNEERTVPADGGDAAAFEAAERRFRLFGREAVSFLETDMARNIDTHFDLKGRCGRVMTGIDGVLGRLADGLRRCGEGYDLVIVPQSRRDLNARLTDMVGLR